MQHKLSLSLNKNKVISWAKKKRKMKVAQSGKEFKVVDLFCGCGGLSLGIESGLQELGFKSNIALAIDNNQSALEVYRNNLPVDEGNAVCTDILNLFPIDAGDEITAEENKLKKHVGSVDFLVAGPPCQGHSNLNNRTRRNDPRNSLYLACIRAVRLFQPQFVVIENVPAVIHSKEGVVKQTENVLKNFGYEVKEIKIDFLSLGLPQKRTRHVLIASKRSELISTIGESKDISKPATLRDFIYDIQNVVDSDGLMTRSGKLSKDNVERVNYLFDNDLYDLPDYMRPPCHKDKEHSYKSVYGRLCWDRPAQTLTSGYGSMGQGRYIHPSQRRTINSHEAARIQGFPDWYDFSSVSSLSALRVMIANAVPPQLTYVLSKHAAGFICSMEGAA